MDRQLEQLWRDRFRMWALVLATVLALGAAHAEDSFLEPEQAFRLHVESGDGGRVSLRWTIAPGYYLYRDRLTVVAASGGPIGNVTRPPGERKVDPNFGEVQVFHAAARIEVDPRGETALEVGWQGCADQGLCYPPQHQTVVLDAATTAPTVSHSNATLPPGLAAALQPGLQASAAAPSQPSAPAATASDASTERGISLLWSGRSLWWSLPFAFVLGIGLAFTPCVLPMVPILSGTIVGQQASGRRALLLSLAFVLPMALVYAAIGLAAASAGASFQAALQNPWAIGGFALLFVLLAFSMFGFYELQLPAFVRDRLAARSPSGGNVAGAAAMGALSALLVGPCMTAPLAGTLLYIAQSGNVAEGGLLLLALGLGMGVPLIVIGTVGARWLPRPGPWMNRVKGAFGFIMLATAAWMLQRVLPGAVSLLLWGALLASAALTLWHTATPGPGGSAALLVARSAAVVAGIWGGAMVFGAAAGATDPVRPLAELRSGAGGAEKAAFSSFEVVRDPSVLQARLDEARRREQPALVDFSAEWCTSCKTLEREVFADPQVVRALGGVLLLRADVTATDAAQREFMRKHQVMGPPTVMLFDARGVERRAERLVGEFASEDLLQRNPAHKEGS